MTAGVARAALVAFALSVLASGCALAQAWRARPLRLAGRNPN
jgi:hypothetical protein